MTDNTLVLGNKSYSSWSLRGWLAARLAGIPFEEVVIPLRKPATREAIQKYSAAGKVPTLVVDGAPIWDSLAIAEYITEESRGGKECFRQGRSRWSETN